MRRSAEGSTRRTSNSPRLRIRGSIVSSMGDSLVMSSIIAQGWWRAARAAAEDIGIH